MSIPAGPSHATTPTSPVIAAQQPIATFTCSRLGRVANPPGFSLTDWLLPGRRR